MNLFLYGPPGSGKSTVGKVLSDRLGFPYADTDKEFKRLYEAEIGTFVEHNGIAVFRYFERSILTNLVQNGVSQIISLGGGTLLDTENQRTIYRNGGRIVTLMGDWDLLWQRIQKDDQNNRPLAKNHEDFMTLMRRRAIHYQNIYPRISVDGKSPQQIANEILLMP